MNKEKYLKHLEIKYKHCLNALTLAKSDKVIQRNKAIMEFINNERLIIISDNY